MKHSILFFICCILLSHSKGQIIAGDTTASHHVIFSPIDTLIFKHALGVYYDTFDFDLDGDNTNDISISSMVSNQGHDGALGFYIQSSNPACSFVADSGLFLGCCSGTYYPAAVPLQIDSGTLITDTSHFLTDAILKRTTYGFATGPYITTWNGEHFIGAQLKYSFDTLYAWLRIELNGDTLFIKETACNNNIHVGLMNTKLNHITLAPNPFSNYLIYSNDLLENAILRIYNIQGDLIYEDCIEPNQIIPTSDLTSEIYQYEILSKYSRIRGRLLKTN